jgi:arginine/lysine/ornithine decarboxylase
MCGAIPVFLMPTRNNLGIIGPIPLEEFTPESIARKIEANPFAREAANKKPRILTITHSTYDGVLYNVETLKDMLDGKIASDTKIRVVDSQDNAVKISLNAHRIAKKPLENIEKSKTAEKPNTTEKDSKKSTKSSERKAFLRLPSLR